MLRLSWSFKGFSKKIKENKIAKKLSSEYDGRLAAEGIESSHASARSAKRAHFVSFIAIALCIVFLFSMLIIFGKDIGPMNMYYFFREVRLMGQIGEGERAQISYSQPTRNQSFAEFKSGFIVASDREVQAFNKAGYETLIEQMSYSNPIVVSSSSTFLVYDLGGRGFTLYNSFEDIYLENREYPISAADMSDDGKFAVVGKSEKYNTEITFYDEDGKREFSYMRSDYAIDCEYSESGKHLALLTLDASGGDYIYTLTILNTKSGEVVSSVTEIGNLPYSCHYMSGDRIAVMCEDYIFTYNNKGETVGEYQYPSGTLCLTAVNERYVVLLFADDRVNMKNTLYIINSRGKVVMQQTVEGEFSDMAASSKYVYLAADKGVYRLDISSLKLQLVEMNAADGEILILDSGRIMLCRQNMSYVIDSWP